MADEVKVIYTADTSGAVTGTHNVEAATANLNTALIRVVQESTAIIKVSQEMTGVLSSGLRTANGDAINLEASLRRLKEEAIAATPNLNTALIRHPGGQTGFTMQPNASVRTPLQRDDTFPVLRDEMNAAQREADGLAQAGQRLTQTLLVGVRPGITEATKATTSFTTHLRNLADSGLRGVESAAVGAAKGVLSMLNPMNDMMAAVGIGFGIDKIIKDTNTWTQQLAMLTPLFDGDAKAASTTAAEFNFFGITNTQLIARMDQMVRRMDTAPQFWARFGIAVRDSNGNLRESGVVFNEVIDRLAKMHATSDATMLANEAFGRSQGSFAQVALEVARNQDQLREAVEKYHLTIDNNGLQSNLQYQGSLRSVQMEFTGLFRMIGIEIMPLIAHLGGMVGGWLAQNFDTIRNAIQGTVVWLMAFISALTGMSDTADPLAASIAHTMGAIDQFNQGVADGIPPAQKNTEAQKQATNALEDKVRVLQDAKTAEDNYIDSQITSLEQTLKQVDATDRLNQLQQTAADDQQKISEDQTAVVQAAFDGNTKEGIKANDTLRKDQQKLANDQNAITKEQVTTSTNAKIEGLRNQKTAEDRAYQNTIDHLQDQISKLREQTSVGVAGSQQLAAAGVGAGQAITNAWQGTNNTMDAQGRLVHGASSGMDGVKASGVAAANAIKQGFTDLNTALGATVSLVNELNGLFVTGKATPSGHPLSLFGPGSVANLPGQLFAKALSTILDPLNLDGRASGGPVFSGRPYIVGERGPELFVPGQSGSIVPNGRFGGGGGITIQGGVHVHGVADPELASQLVQEKIAEFAGGYL